MKRSRMVKKSPYKVVRLARAHARLWLSAAFGVAVYLVVPAPIAGVTRMLIGWDAGIFVYIAAAVTMMARSPVSEIRRHADAQDEGDAGIMVLTLAAATASFGAIFAELAAAGDDHAFWPELVAIVTVLLSWTFTHGIFALHYAYEYYGGRHVGGLKFPGSERPDYWDFVYFAFVIGMTFQVSDVQIESKPIRRVVVLHGVLSFVFTTTIIALTVNMAANAV